MPTLTNSTAYTITGEAGTQLQLNAKNIVDVWVARHTQNKNAVSANPATDLTRAIHGVCSAFQSTSAPDTPNTCDRKKATHHTNMPLRSFLYVTVTHKNQTDEAQFLDDIDSFISKYQNPDYILYPDIEYPTKNKWHFILKLERLLDKEQYTAVMNFLLNELNMTPSKTALKDLLSVTKPFPEPIYGDANASAETRFNVNSTGLPVDDTFLTNLGVPDKDTNAIANVQYDANKLTIALKNFALLQTTPIMMADDAERKEFFAAIACAIAEGLIGQGFINEAIETLATDTQTAKDYKLEYEDIADTLRKNPDRRLRVKPIGSYIPLYVTDSEPLNIAEQLLSHLGEDFTPDPKIELADAAAMISMVYPPSIIKQPGNDKANVVIFNPLTGVWTHDEDLFYSLLTAIRPYSTVHQLDTLMRTFAAQARNANRYIKPYSGSRYLLFKNGVVDITDMSLHSVLEPFVREQYFTERSRLNVDFVYDPPLPVIKDGRVAGGDWNPQDFVNAYGNNDPERVRYFLFGLSLGLFGSHNFGVHFDIQGESRWGKTTLSEIFNNLYENRTVIISFTALNGRFPFTSYPLSTSLIWIKECNVGIEPLNDDHGTVIYDGLADNQVRFEVKGGNDIVLSNPPPVFIDGTQLIQAREINTGPAGRTLAYKLPTMTQALRDQAYANNIVETLHRDDVTQWLVYHMLKSYRDIIPAHRRSDLKLNLSVSGDLDLLPEFAQEWRREFSSDSSDLDQWFIQEIDPYLSDDPNNPSLMHNRIFYELYITSYKRSHPHDKYLNRAKPVEQFERQLVQLLEQNGWNIQAEGTASNNRSKTKRKRVSTLDALNFNWTEYEQSYVRPKSLKTTDETTGGLEGLFGSLQAGWFSIHRKIES